MSDKKDFFISYTGKDENWATWIAGILEKANYTTIIQAWDFGAGSNFVLEMHNAIKCCDRVILVISQNYNQSIFCQPEWTNFFVDDPHGKWKSIIPVRIEETSLEGLLKSIVRIDLFDKCSEEEAESCLVDSLKKPVRIKPKFPGGTGITDKLYQFHFIVNPNSESNIDKELRMWFNNGRDKDFIIEIDDMSLHALNDKIAEIEKQIEAGKQLNEQEENQLSNLHYSAINIKDEIELKKWACYFCLKDTRMQEYLSITTLPKLYQYLMKIIQINYFKHKRQRKNDRNYVELEFSIYPTPKECNNYFLASLPRDKVAKIAKTNLDFLLLSIQDLGIELLTEVSIYYYYFLAEEMVIYKNLKLVENKDVLTLLNFQVGLH